MRRAIRDPLDVGVSSINAFAGRRPVDSCHGFFACSGVGKSVLLGLMTR